MATFGGFGASPFGSTFGAPAASSPATTATPFGFGPTTFPSLSTTSSASPFGPSTTTNPTPSLFGATTAPTLSLGGTSNPFNPFGTPTATAPASTSFGASTPSLFGTTAPTLSLGTTTSTQANPFNPFGTPTATPSPFGTTPAFGTSTFPSASTSSSLFPTQSPTPAPTSSLQSLQPAQQTPLQKLEALYCCFNPAHPQCKFRHMFYNQINASPDEVKRMNATKPPQIDQLLWDQACRNNPDPARFVPVQACGFDELKQRITEQNKLTDQQLQTLQDAAKLIDHIKHQHTNNTMAKLEDYKRHQLEISQRLIRVICKLMVMEARGSRLTQGEENLKRRFELMLQDLASPILYRAKIEDFIALSRISVPSTQLPQLDDKALENIAKALKEQRAGLEVLTTMVQKDSKDVQLMMSELNTQ